jgi:hypothetical protein
MNPKYFIAQEMLNFKKEKVTGYYAQDRASGGYPYFNDSINCSEVKAFKTLEDAKQFLKEEYRIKDGKLGFNGYGQDNLIGFPRIVKLSFITECVWEMT